MPLNVPYGSQESQEDSSSQPVAAPVPFPTPAVPVGAFSVPLNGGPKVSKTKLSVAPTFLTLVSLGVEMKEE